MVVEFVKVNEGSDLELLAKLADEIWMEYWPSRIGMGQTKYMVEQFQCLDAIKRGIAEHGYEYWFMCVDDGVVGDYMTEDGKHIVGYTGGYVEVETNRYFISKIYLLACERGKHYASPVFDFYTAICRERGLRAMYLTVNKYNEMGTRAYLAKGFEIIDSVETDIGEGYIMDDYIMERQV